jgi:hypothetical protein
MTKEQQEFEEQGFKKAVNALRLESGKCNCFDRVDSCQSCQHRRSSEWLLSRKQQILSGNNAG